MTTLCVTPGFQLRNLFPRPGYPVFLCTVVLVHSGCYKRIPQTRWLTHNQNAFLTVIENGRFKIISLSDLLCVKALLPASQEGHLLAVSSHDPYLESHYKGSNLIQRFYHQIPDIRDWVSTYEFWGDYRHSFSLYQLYLFLYNAK